MQICFLGMLIKNLGQHAGRRQYSAYKDISIWHKNIECRARIFKVVHQKGSQSPPIPITQWVVLNHIQYFQKAWSMSFESSFSDISKANLLQFVYQINVLKYWYIQKARFLPRYIELKIFRYWKSLHLRIKYI